MSSGSYAQELVARLQQWYRHQAGIADAEIADFQLPVSGVVNETYLHTVNFQRGGERVRQPAVLRIQPATSDTPIPDVDVGEQAFVLGKLAGIGGLLTPRVLWNEPEAHWLGRPFYIMERMPGEAVFDAGTVPDDAATLRSMYQQAISMLARIHAVDWEQGGLQPLYRGTSGQSPLQVQLSAYRAHLDTASPDKRYPLLEQAYEWLQENLPAVTRPVLNWGDARVGNFLFDGAQLSAVLDWEIADITAREVDMGWFLFFERFLRKDGVETRAGAMSDAELVALYEQQSGVGLAPLEYFQRWAAFRLAVMRVRAGVFAIRSGKEPANSRVDEINFASIELARVFGFAQPE